MFICSSRYDTCSSSIDKLGETDALQVEENNFDELDLNKIDDNIIFEDGNYLDEQLEDDEKNDEAGSDKAGDNPTDKSAENNELPPTHNDVSVNETETGRASQNKADSVIMKITAEIKLPEFGGVRAAELKLQSTDREQVKQWTQSKLRIFTSFRRNICRLVGWYGSDAFCEEVSADKLELEFGKFMPDLIGEYEDIQVDIARFNNFKVKFPSKIDRFLHFEFFQVYAAQSDGNRNDVSFLTDCETLGTFGPNQVDSYFFEIVQVRAARV